jgi:hypothetical protein
MMSRRMIRRDGSLPLVVTWPPAGASVLVLHGTVGDVLEVPVDHHVVVGARVADRDLAVVPGDHDVVASVDEADQHVVAVRDVDVVADGRVVLAAARPDHDGPGHALGLDVPADGGVDVQVGRALGRPDAADDGHAGVEGAAGASLHGDVAVRARGVHPVAVLEVRGGWGGGRDRRHGEDQAGQHGDGKGLHGPDDTS